MSGKRKGPGGGRPGGRSEDPWQDPGLLRWMKRCETELVPMIRGSQMTASILPDEDGVDLKFAIELGLMIMMDKPIVLMVSPGRKVPDHMVRVSDAIVDFDPNDLKGSEARFLEVLDELGFTRDDTGYAMEMRQNPPPIQVPDELPAFTCPRCGATSHNPNDVAEGYCGNCHDWPKGHTLSAAIDTITGITLKAVCHEQPGAPCKRTCEQGCEEWGDDHEHALVPTEECNAAVWLDESGMADCYDGPGVDLNSGMPIEVFWDGDGYLWRELTA